MRYLHTITKTLLPVFILAISSTSCKKMLEIDPPLDTISTVQIFSSDAHAEGALAGVYSRMVNGEGMQSFIDVPYKAYASGLSTLLGGLSSDEMTQVSGVSNFRAIQENKIMLTTSLGTAEVWSSAYKIVYGANAVIEGIAGSTSKDLRDSTRKQLIAEAKFLRAFSFFYLTNFFGDVPLVLTVDFNQTWNMARTPQRLVYDQIINDLKDAQAALPTGYTVGGGERIRPNKWAATAMLARVYLFTGEYENAMKAATDVIDQHIIFELEPDLNNVFSYQSREAIWQLKQTQENATLRNATPEGYCINPLVPFKHPAGARITPELLSAFEGGDKRYDLWLDSTDNTGYNPSAPPNYTWYPTKYKTGQSNAMFGVPGEYYMALRLAEQYLIRAEANALGASGGASAAVDDLNVIRGRAGIDLLPKTLTPDQLKAAIAKERQTELFAEWGHRWFDLKRTGKATEVLSQVGYKQPWEGDYQLVYPIPVNELQNNNRLTQNIGYR
ncbi:MAG: RagB/SusD family nutrient uptake outer membrane protein [Pseudobacter sp.]|uniref:RagB/SusD family nutrient uptake outer membrane protein n=1 Tax=Pseudobacter sp. TaxID=2045420 RepID=UPI003F810682